MYSLKHVLWRGAMALSLLALGIGGGFGFQQESLQASQAPACDDTDWQARKSALVIDEDVVAMADVVTRARG
jgi:hypothetical protein